MILRRLRGAVVVGITWALLWTVIGFTVGTIIGFIDPSDIDRGEESWRVAWLIGFVGFLSGAFFSAIMALAERNKSVSNLSIVRATIWGVLGGAILPLLTTMSDRIVITTAPLGAFSAAATIALARWAAQRQPDAAPAQVEPA